MPFKRSELRKLSALRSEIESRRSASDSYPTYKDSPDLRKMSEIIISHHDTDPESLIEANSMLRYIASCYDDMGRPGLSVRYYEKLLHNSSLLGKKYFSDPDRLSQLEEDTASAFWARNYYERDDCADLFDMLSELIPAVYLNELLLEAQESITIRNDPVEMTEAYLTVIDEVEQLVDEQKLCDNCNEIWGLKRHFLEEHGVEWKSPAILNPGVVFE